MTEAPLANTSHLLPTLRCARRSPDAWAADVPPLGAIGWGLASRAGLAGLDVRVLSAPGPCVDVWLGGGALHRGRSGGVDWHGDGHWAFGSIDVPGFGGELAEATRQAYLDVFAALRDAGTPHPLRLWNYLPHINAEDGGGMERYRQFNIGRQRAFIESGRDAFEGAPAACALGHRGSGLSIRFLAGRQPPLPLENPRQVPAYRYSAAYGPRSPTFSRAALADVGGGQLALFVSGTASIVGEHSVHVGDLRAQVRETLVNLQAVVDAARERCSAGFVLADLDCSIYVRHAAQADAVRAEFEAGVGATSHAARTAVCLEADICRSELLVEIEGHALAPGALKR